MALPQFLLIEMRNAFKLCARQRSHAQFRYFSGNASYSKSVPARGTSNRTKSVPKTSSNSRSNLQRETDHQVQKGNGTTTSKDVVPREQDQNSVGTERKIPVPMKVFPKADITPKLRLSPKERLHLEAMTRRQPPPAEKKVYRERLLIYHWGFGKENALAILKMSCIVGLCGVTFIIAPAHFVAGTPLWLTSMIFLGGFIPAIVVNYMTKPMVSRVFLRLPVTARDSPKAAMEYAKNLPENAELDIRFLRPWALEGSIQARMSEFEPTQNSFLRPLTFRWIDSFAKKGSIWLRNPTKFFVAPKSATGKAARDTIPGLWENVYKRLSGVDSEAVARWKQ